MYSLDYTTDSKVTWKQISRWSYGKQDHDIGIKNKIHTEVHLGVKDKGPKLPMLVEMNFRLTSTALWTESWENFDPILWHSADLLCENSFN